MLDSTQKTQLLLSVTDAAACLGIGRTLFLQLDREGKIPMGRKLGNRKLWSYKELDAWVLAGMPLRKNWMEINKAS